LLNLINKKINSPESELAMTTSDSSDLYADIKTLVGSFKTVLMATASKDGEPEISYSPYVICDGLLHVLVSDLSVHTGNLKVNPQASLLFIESEESAEKLHARKRVTYSASAKQISRDTDHWRRVLDVMQEQFGDIIPVLESLPDFHLFAMDTDCAVLVKGFADAHTLECKGF